MFGWTLDEQGSFAVLDAYWQAGGNFIDTADMYGRRGPEGPGSSERLIGRWMSSRGNRDELVIATKVGMAMESPGLSADNIAAGLDASLERLGIERIDLYYAHQDDPRTPLLETMTAFDEHVRAGKVAHVAGSNYSAERLREALDVSREHGLSAYVALQPHYNLVERSEYEGELERVCAEAGVACVPYFGLARGFLTGKYRSGGTAVDSPRAKGVLDSYDNPRGHAVLEALLEVAGAQGEPPAAVALAWLLSKPTVLAPIASATSADQLAESMRAPELVLSEAQLQRLDAAGA